MKFFERYEIYIKNSSSPLYHYLNWYVLLFALLICVINTGLALSFGYINPLIGIINLILIMPLSPLMIMHIRKKEQHEEI